MAETQPFRRAFRYIAERLERDLPPQLDYHGPHHTLQDVLPAAERLGRAAALDRQELLILKTAALYHDIGYVVQYHENETCAQDIARETLPGFGYSEPQIARICRAIWATRFPQDPHDRLAELMCDADLDYLGRPDFPRISEDLRNEWAVYDRAYGPEAWCALQIEFLESHSYYTPEARELRDAGKAANLKTLHERCRRFAEADPRAGY